MRLSLSPQRHRITRRNRNDISRITQCTKEGDTDSIPQLKESIRHAEVLLGYAGSNGVKIERGVLDAIAHSCELFDKGKLIGAQEADFHENFIALSRAIAPVTAKSLESCIVRRKIRWFFWHRQETYAERSLRRIRIWGALGLSLLVAAQTYWVVGSYLTAKIPILSDVDSASQNAIYQEARWQLPPSAKENSGEKTPNNANQDSPVVPPAGPVLPAATISESDPRFKMAVDLTVDRINLSRQKTFDWLLDVWNTPANAIVLGCYNHSRSQANARDPAANTVVLAAASEWISGFVAKLVLNTIQSYILPPLYGMVGAVAYVLRQLIDEVRSRTYREDSDISYNLRIFLGALAGLAIGWFFPPTSGEQHVAVLQSLSPLALAFLGGYSVELLFLAMDKLMGKLLDALSSTSQSAERSKGS